jgi:hypothetical protein
MTPGWRGDPELTRLWLKGIRATPKKAVALEQQFITRATAQAYFLSVVDAGLYTFVNTKKVQLKRQIELAFQVIDWSPAK